MIRAEYFKDGETSFKKIVEEYRCDVCGKTWKE